MKLGRDRGKKGQRERERGKVLGGFFSLEENFERMQKGISGNIKTHGAKRSAGRGCKRCSRFKIEIGLLDVY